MSAQRASAPARFAVVLSAIVLVAVAAAVAVRLAGRREAPAAPAAAPPPEDRVVDLKERVRHEEYEAGRLVAEIRGDTFALGPDGRNRLTGSVEVAFFGRDGRTVSRLTCGEIAYAPGTQRFAARGAVRVEAADVVLEGDSFEYDKPAGLFETAKGGRFASPTLTGSAPEIAYAESTDEVRLGGGFRIELAANGGALILSGRSLRYSRREREIRMEGGASIEGEGFRAAAEMITFIASADEAGFDSAVLEGGPKFGLGGKTALEGSGELGAERMELMFSQGPDALNVKASGHAGLTFRPEAGGTMAVSAPSARIGFIRPEGPWTGEAKGGVRAELAEAGGAIRTIEGDTAVFDGGSVRVYGVAGREAVADSAEARLEADEISARPASRRFFAKGGVTGVLKAGDGSPRTGFFARGEDVVFACKWLQPEPDADAYLLRGSVIVSQGSSSVRGNEIELAGDAGRMSGGGGVAITLTEAGPDGSPPRTVEIGGQEMAYRPDTRTLKLTGQASVRLSEARLEAGRVTAVLARDGRTVETLEAGPGVVVSKGAYTGRAEAASYDPATGLLVLTGKPVLTDGKGGSARGAKLTFDLADDRILIENEGPGRSTIIVKS